MESQSSQRLQSYFHTIKKWKINNTTVSFFDGFINKNDKAQNLPVGAQIDKTDALLVADDVVNIIWRMRQE